MGADQGHGTRITRGPDITTDVSIFLYGCLVTAWIGGAGGEERENGAGDGDKKEMMKLSSAVLFFSSSNL